MAPRVLISDTLSPAALAIFEARGLEVDYRPDIGRDREKLAEIIGDYDGLAIRSSTKVTAKLLERAPRLKIIGRAGLSVDNIDVPAATARGVIVMNTPFGNSITTAEHAIALLFALARRIPEADASTRQGKWEKFLGVEITGKILGLIGCGSVGSIVADRAIGLRMRVMAYDPFLSPERAFDLGVEKMELDELLARADFLSLHTPVTPHTKNILSKENLAKTKPGVMIINSCRAALIDEAALLDLLQSGHVAGVAIDILEKERQEDHPLFRHRYAIVTPHLGASTREAQENVARQIAEQMSDYLMRDAISNAINYPSITAEEAPKLKPFIALADRLGSFAGQLIESNIVRVSITYEGEVADLKIKALSATMMAALLRPLLAEVNVVSAPTVARELGVVIDEVTRAAEADFESIVTLCVEAGGQERSVSGTVFNDGKPRIIMINGIKVDAAVGPAMVYVTNEDRPGFIGRFASILGNAGINIATFALGRDREGGSSIALVEVDESVPEKVLDAVRRLAGVKEAKALRF
ncbi:phosphoglycerate dehydrogenase [Methylocella silvestris]|uniref:D-3-phosphoglycerate dehydrogenase n=1 Tax=Methylocella silvestris TaxID=199596 RepID=A0A2J7TJY2_METSI|nr:phosphoglycerate dehydrogenase [Methylocella silvestris]PNG27075.1 phosphoglycerate dehydrogenase [Methylocella silvestris]